MCRIVAGKEGETVMKYRKWDAKTKGMIVLAEDGSLSPLDDKPGIRQICVSVRRRNRD